jgi:hypothetical protein
VRFENVSQIETYAVGVGVRATSPVIIRVDSRIGLVGKVAGVRSRVCGTVGTRGSASRTVSASSGAGGTEAGGLVSCQY